MYKKLHFLVFMQLQVHTKKKIEDSLEIVRWWIKYLEVPIISRLLSETDLRTRLVNDGLINQDAAVGCDMGANAQEKFIS